MSKELKKCPFCGEEVNIIDVDPNDDVNYYLVECRNEECGAAACFGEFNKEEVIKHWNRRTTDE